MRGGCERIDDVALEVVCHDETQEFLRSIGMHTVGDLSRLPREGLALRCGRRLLDEIDYALGALPEPRAFFEPPPRFSARLELPAPVVHAEGLAFAARRLLVQLEGLLAARQAGVRRIHPGPADDLPDEEAVARVDIGLASPARDAERFTRLLQEKFSSLQIVRPVEAIRVEAADFVPLDGLTAGMFGDAAAEAEDWARLARAPAGAPGARRRVRPRHAARSSSRARVAARRAGRVGSARIPPAGAAAVVAA